MLDNGKMKVMSTSYLSKVVDINPLSSMEGFRGSIHTLLMRRQIFCEGVDRFKSWGPLFYIVSSAALGTFACENPHIHCHVLLCVSSSSFLRSTVFASAAGVSHSWGRHLCNKGTQEPTCARRFTHRGIRAPHRI